MNRIATVPLLAALLAAAPASTAQSALIERMAALNPNLQAFTATLHAHVQMRSIPFLSLDLVGTYYYERPDKNKVVFTGGVPLVAAQFDKLYANIEPPSRWASLYDVALLSDDGSTAHFRLIPRKPGNIASIEATGDDRSATVTAMRWNYANGGFASLSNQYRNEGGNLVVESQSGRISEPGYAADITSTIDGYAFNPKLPEGIFSKEQ